MAPETVPFGLEVVEPMKGKAKEVVKKMTSEPFP